MCTLLTAEWRADRLQLPGFMAQSMSRVMASAAGTPLYMAPEMLDEEEAKTPKVCAPEDSNPPVSFRRSDPPMHQMQHQMQIQRQQWRRRWRPEAEVEAVTEAEAEAEARSTCRGSGSNSGGGGGGGGGRTAELQAQAQPQPQQPEA